MACCKVLCVCTHCSDSLGFFWVCCWVHSVLPYVSRHAYLIRTVKMFILKSQGIKKKKKDTPLHIGCWQTWRVFQCFLCFLCFPYYRRTRRGEAWEREGFEGFCLSLIGFCLVSWERPHSSDAFSVIDPFLNVQDPLTPFLVRARRESRGGGWGVCVVVMVG